MLDAKTRLILDSLMVAEGGYWNDPVGGPTKHGITQSTLDAVRRKFPDVSLPETVYELDEHSARLILLKEYIEAKNILALPFPLAIFHSHMVVMSWDDGIRIMQKRLGVTVDGIIGSKTLNAVRSDGTLNQLYGLARDVYTFIETRDNGYADSYRTRFDNIPL